jgi:hypothetical protein
MSGDECSRVLLGSLMGSAAIASRAYACGSREKPAALHPPDVSHCNEIFLQVWILGMKRKAQHAVVAGLSASFALGFMSLVTLVYFAST